MFKYIILYVFGLGLLAQQVEPTNNYLALTATLLEHRIIGDEHLLRIIDGQLNPILEREAQIDSQKLIASQAYSNILPSLRGAERDAAIQQWAKQRLSKEAQEREEKKKKQEETRNLSNLSPYQLIAINDIDICYLGQGGKLECSRHSVPDLTGKQISSFNRSMLLLTSEKTLFEISLTGEKHKEIYPEYNGKIENFAFHTHSTYNRETNKFDPTSHLCLLLNDGVTTCKTNQFEFFNAPASHEKTASLQIVKDALYRLSPNGDVDCFNLKDKAICTPPETSQKVKHMVSCKSSDTRFCFILKDGEHECFYSSNQEKIQIAWPKNSPPVEMIFQDYGFSCGLFQTGLFSCWDDKGTYIDKVSEIPGIISADIGTGKVCTVNEFKQHHCYQVYNVMM